MTRKSNFELLRILAMFLIVAHHYSVHGAWSYPYGFELHKFYTQILSIGGKVGVDIFVLISGYFLYNKKFNINSIINIISKTFFYVLVIAAFFKFTNIIHITPMIFIRSITGYWFVIAYLFLILLSPYINIMINNFDKKTHLRFILIFSLIIFMPKLNVHIGNVGLFIYIYCIGAFIKKYCETTNLPTGIICFAIIINVAIIILSIYLIDYLSHYKNSLEAKALYFIGGKTPFIMCLSICVFILMKQSNLGSNKYINSISSAMFGVYLIHDNDIMRGFLWVDLLQNNKYLNSDLIYVHSIFSITSVFVVCTAIDLVRSKLATLLKTEKIQHKISENIFHFKK